MPYPEINEGNESEPSTWEQHILVILFIIQQRWDYYINKRLVEDEITTKQWLMMAIIKNTFDHDPFMQEVADTLSTTHQNIKQLAVRLESRCLLKLERDQNNQRILRLKTTENGYKYLEKKASEDIKTINSLFKDLNDCEVKYLFKIMAKLEIISEELYQDMKSSKTGKN